MATTYLSRTPSTGVNRRTFTFSAWIKRARINAYDIIFEASNGSHSFQMATNPTGDGDCIRIYDFNGTTNLAIKTNQAFRDLSAWYHIVLAIDTTQATNTNRAKFYVNGEQVTSLATSTYPSLDYDTGLNNSVPMQIGRQQSSSDYFNGSMTHIHFIDGLAYDADTFGETDSTTGIWKPKTAPSVTYGTNGFFLKGENSSALGTDSSGRGNNFTVNGTPTQTIDTPANVFATLNPLALTTRQTLSNGNLTGTSSSWTSAISTFGFTKGKYYAEVKYVDTTGNIMVGVMDEQDMSSLTGGTGGLGFTTNSVGYYSSDGTKFIGDSASSYGASYTANDILGIAVDLDSATKTVTFYKNEASQGVINLPTTGTGTFFIGTSTTSNGISAINFGNGFFGTTAVASAQNPDDGIGIFEYDVPAGYRALCTKSINAEEYS